MIFSVGSHALLFLSEEQEDCMTLQANWKFVTYAILQELNALILA